MEPIRSIIKGVDAVFLEATATDVCFNDKLVEVTSLPYNGEEKELVIAVGSQSITHGIEGIQYCHSLKTINDARTIRKKIMDNFELASLPTTTPEERKRLLSFVVCGGGPTGVEFAAELYDFLTEDLVRYFPAALRKEVQVSIIQSSDHILNTYDKRISDFAEKKFERDNINVITNAQKISSKLPEQKNKRALVTDNRLRLKGIKDSSIYAIGDCSTVENPKLVEGLMKFFIDADVNKDGVLGYDEFSKLVKKISKSYPITSSHLRKAHNLFKEFDKDKSGTLELNELRDMLENIDKRLTSLPATAQVAHQQGSLAYIGNAAVADFGMGYTWMGGWSAVYLWRSIYFSEQVSFRTRALLFLDWTKRFVFGRDISKS
ncbi:11900_t:CDS:10 [Diversispora eburnea]|uniref:11900_t:CDS:1 n=1 Tax=Diversispora eburnea TaxID=1213867 RepID=A0A9N9F9I4_9GLOM|nr:11900_t:CDS:10 [Diversispora eburnea]